MTAELAEPLCDDEGSGIIRTTATNPRAARARSVSMKRLSKRALAEGAAAYPKAINDATPRPATYGECEALELGTDANPCPYVSCRYHLALDVNPVTGSVKLNFPGLEVWELPETCALRVADRGGITLEEVGELMNLTRERIRQLEERSAARMRGSPLAAALGADFGFDGDGGPASLAPAEARDDATSVMDELDAHAREPFGKFAGQDEPLWTAVRAAAKGGE